MNKLYTHAISKVKLDNGEILNLPEAIARAENAEIQGVNVVQVRDGYKCLRSNPDAEWDNNLKNLPRF